MNFSKWLGVAFFTGTLFSATSIFANTIPASVTIQDDLVAASITPSSLVFKPDIGEFDSNEIMLENTGDIAFYPSVEYTAFSNTGEVEQRGIDILSTDKMLFKIGSNEVDMDVPGVYPKGKTSVGIGETYRIPLSVGAGKQMPKTESKNLTFKVTITLDKVMKVVENLQAIQNGTSAELTWDPFTVDGETSDKYRIYAFKLNSSTGKYQRVGIPKVANGTSYTWTGLQNSEEYKFEVIPLYNNAYRSKALSSTTLSLAAPDGEGQNGEDIVVIPNQVQNVQANVTNTTLNLTWDQFGNSTQYRIYIAKKLIGETTFGTAMPYSATGTNYSRNLQAGYDHKITVVPYGKSGWMTDKTSEPILVTIP